MLFQARKTEDDLEELDEEKLLKSDDEGDGLVIIFWSFSWEFCLLMFL